MPLSNLNIAKIIRHEEEDAKGVLSFQPKHLDMEMPTAAKQFISEQPTEKPEQRFQIDELISKQTGIFNDEKKKIEKEIEDRVIDKIKDIQETAYKEAYELGLQEGKKLAFETHNESIKNDLTEIQNLLESVRSMKKNILDQNEALFIDLLYFICEKVVAEHVAKNETTVKEILKQVIDSLDSKENVSIRLNDQDFETVKKLMQEVNQESDVYKKLKFYPTPDVEKGGCIFETDHGLVDATIKERLDKLWTILNDNKPANS
jgi:flagellar assembly protein FliH